ncbi:MAG: phosphatase PAP2 family protein [Abitibacteriaceae bacterium]|nr:phosphatase PAP2 family protein [Abditibacteriaceae bacterium]
MAIKHLANLVNPLLFVLLVVAPFMATRQRERPVAATRPTLWLFLVRAIVGLLVVYVFAHVNRWLHLWPSHKLFPSGHLAFTASVATSLFLLDRRWLWLMLPLTLIYSAMVVALGYHVWLDIFGAWIIAPPLTYICHAIIKPSATLPVAASDTPPRPEPYGEKL